MDRINLSHLNDEEMDLCEHCLGQKAPAKYTMYRLDSDGNTHPESDNGSRMCSNCAFDAFEAGEWNSEEGMFAEPAEESESYSCVRCGCPVSASDADDNGGYCGNCSTDKTWDSDQMTTYEDNPDSF